MYRPERRGGRGGRRGERGKKGGEEREGKKILKRKIKMEEMK